MAEARGRDLQPTVAYGSADSRAVAARALGVLSCETALTYLERISCRPGNAAAIRTREWSRGQAHDYWIRRLKAGGWLHTTSDRIRVDLKTVRGVRSYVEELSGLRTAYLIHPPAFEVFAGAVEPIATGDPRDLLLALATPSRRQIYEGLAGEPLRIGRLASRLGLVRSLVSYHAKQLHEAGLIARTAAGALGIDRRVAGAALQYLAHLEIGWPYPSRPPMSSTSGSVSPVAERKLRSPSARGADVTTLSCVSI